MISEITPATFAEGTTVVVQGSIAATRTLAADSYLRITASYDLSLGTPTCTIADNNGNGGTYSAALDAANDGTAGQGGVQFITTTPTKAGSCTITVTFSINVFSATICIQEIAGSSGPDSGKHTSQLQASPGTGTDAVSSGNITPSNQPALIAGLTMDLGGSSTGTPSAGTGFTDSGSGWNLGVGHDLARAESKRVTSVSAVAATFTASSNDRYGTWAAVFLEASDSLFFGCGTTS